MRPYFSLGLDISGSSRSKSHLVVTRMRELHCQTILLGSLPSLTGYGEKVSTSKYAEIQLQFIEDSLKKIREKYWTDLPYRIPLIVDVPIDLSELIMYLSSDEDDFRKLTANTKPDDLIYRSVDKKYGGLAPFGSNMGQVVMRFKNMFNHSNLTLGVDLFETYPGACLIEMGKRYGKLPSYKGTKTTKINWESNRWDDSINQNKANGLLELIRKFKISGPYNKNIILTEDHFDAIICSLVGLRDRYCICRNSQVEPHTLPKGYKLIKYKFWKSIEVIDSLY